MLIHTMTEEETLKEVKRDFRAWAYSSVFRFCERYAKERKKRKVEKSKEYIKVCKTKSPRKNNWIFLLQKDPIYTKYKSVSNTSFTMIVYYYTDKGFRVFKVVPSSKGEGLQRIDIYNSHLFKRYAERMGLDITKPIEVAIEFFKNNNSSTGRISKEDNCSLASICKDGLLLGESKEQYLIYKTFVSRDLLFKNQIDEEKDLLEKLQDSIQELLNRDTFNVGERLEYEFKSSVMKNIKGSSHNKI